MKNWIYELHTVEEVDQFLKQFPLCAFFKAGSCHKTSQGFGYVEKTLHNFNPIPMGVVHVVDYRPVSNHITELTGVVHQSPQFILMVNSKPVFDLDNWDITPVALQEGLSQFLSAPEVKKVVEVQTATQKSDVSAYMNLLQKFVNGEISEEDFENKWLIAFQCDASLRSIEEFDTLNSLFGDVDKALKSKQPASAKGPLSIANPTKDVSLKDKALNLLEILKNASN